MAAELIERFSSALGEAPSMLCKLGAGALSVITLAGGPIAAAEASLQTHSKRSTHEVNILAQQYGVQPSTITGTGLHSPAKLPGRNKKVSNVQRHELAAATVAVL